MENRIDKIKEKGLFALIDHSTTHNQFLYRHYVKLGLNKDILISGVSYISLPTSIEDFKIYKAKGNELKTVRKKVDPFNYKKVFVFEQKEFKHYVIADRIYFQENNYKLSETSIPCKREKINSIEELEELAVKIKKEFDENGLEFMMEKFIRASNWKILE